MENDIFTCETEEEFLKNKYELHKINHLGRNALFTCTLEKTKWLVKYGININLLDYDGNNAIMNIPSNQLDKAYYLLSIGADLMLFINNPEKLMLGNIRSGPVSKVIQEYIPQYLEQIALKEKDKIEISISCEHTDVLKTVLKKRL